MLPGVGSPNNMIEPRGTEPDQIVSIDVQRDGEEAVLRIAGELDMYSEAQLQYAISELDSDSEIQTVVLDLSQTEFLDSSGLRAMLAAERRLQAEGRTMKVRSPSALVARLLEVTSLADHFDIEK
jgi:anti-sigma B factor antagonist